MKIFKVLFAASAALLLAVGCQKYDDSALTQRISGLEQKVSSVESQISALQNAIDQKITVSKVETTDAGWKITFSDNKVIDLTNGKFTSVTVDGSIVNVTLNDEAKTTFVLSMAKNIAIDPDEDFIEVQYGVKTNVPYYLPEGVEFATVAATVLYADGSATDIKTKAASSDWTVEIISDNSIQIGVDDYADFKDAILQVSAIAKDGTSYTASKLIKITAVCYGNYGYRIARMKDGKVWMTDNLHYVPEGYTPSNDLTNVTAGVYFPVIVSGDKTKAAFGTAEDALTNGYLYQSEVALGLKVGGITSVEQAQSLEGTQGICPNGWHIPTIDDIIGLVGKAVSPIATKTDAPYYNGTNGSLMLLNNDGFNLYPQGAVTIQDNTKTSATLMGFLKNYDTITSGYYCGSTYAGVTMDQTKIKNCQFYGLMPMTNKAEEADFTANGSKLSYRIGASVRCVKNN